MKIRLENWAVVATNLDPYKAPEQATSHLQGKVYGHPRIDDGKKVITSAIIGGDKECVLTRSGSKYQLGVVDPDYEKNFPNAKKRLFKSFADATERMKGDAGK